LSAQSDVNLTPGDDPRLVNDLFPLPKRLRKTTQLYLYLLMHLAGRAFG